MPVALQTGENRHNEVAERKLGFCLGDNTLHSLSKRNYPRSNLIYMNFFIFPGENNVFHPLEACSSTWLGGGQRRMSVQRVGQTHR